MSDPTTVKFHYLKSTQHRVVHADGVYGGASPGQVVMSFYSERPPIPRMVEHKIQDGVLGEEISRDAKDGIVREVEVTIALPLNMIRVLRDWLSEVIRLADAAGGGESR